jgi:phage terminase large subunit-like protein
MSSLQHLNPSLTRFLASPLAAAKIETEQRRRQSPFRTLFPEEGELRRELYVKHGEFFAAGSGYLERLFMAANRVGKTIAGAYETTCHLTGKYPEWWQGKRFNHSVEAWACGTTSETTRDIVQIALLGALSTPGSGMIPAELIEKTTRKMHGLADAVEQIRVKHVSGKISTVGLKTYEQGRKSFEGTARHLIWCDEEPPGDCYQEMKMRLLTTNGCIYTTFTPLRGMSDVVKSFLEPDNAAMRAVKYYVQAGWGDAPHLNEEANKAMLAGLPPHQVRARTLGEPSLGAGAIYPIAEESVLVDTFPIPDDWQRVFALDVGWNRTAVLWGARDPGNGRIILYDEHYQGQGEPASHALSIKARGERIRGVIDPAARGRSQIDGRQLLWMYQQLGLDLSPANNTLEAGIASVWQAVVSGQLKAQRHLHQWRREFGRYHRDDKGNIPSQDDHLMDCMRYLWVSGRDLIDNLYFKGGPAVLR